MKFQPNGSVFVTSALVPGSDAPAHKLIFTPGDSGQGTMRLVDSEDGKYSELQRFWISERSSIPSLLANLTLEYHARFVEGMAGDRLSIR